MLERLDRINGTRHQQVLPKIFTLSRATFFVTVMQAGHEFHGARVVLVEACPVTQVNWQAAQGAQEHTWVDPKLAGKDPVELD